MFFQQDFRSFDQKMSEREKSNVIVFNPSHFSIHRWQRKVMSQIDTIELQYSVGIQNQIINMREFIHLFKMPITHLFINIQGMHLKDEFAKEYLKFIIEDLYPMYQSQITQLTLNNLKFTINNKQEEAQKQNSIEMLLLPLKSLTHVTINQDYVEFQIQRDLHIQEIIQVLRSYDQFNSILHLSVLQENSEQDDESFKLKKNTLMNFQASLIEKISSMTHLQNLQLSLLNMSFFPEFYQNTYKNIVKMENLQQVGLDLWSRNCSLKQQISYLKMLTAFSKTLKELTFLSNSNCKASDAIQLKDTLLQFQNLEELYLNGIIFSQKAHFESFSQYFLSFTSLKKLKLDLEETSWKKMRINSILENALKNSNQIEDLSIIYPAELAFDKQEYLDLQKFIQIPSSTLKYLHLNIKNQTYCDEMKQAFSFIIGIENLIVLSLNLDSYIIELNGQIDLVQNIRQVKSFNFDTTYSQSALIINLKWLILKQLTNLKSLQFSFYDLQHLVYPEEDLIKHLQQYQLENLEIESSKYKDFDKTAIQIINQNKNSLKRLKCQFYSELDVLPNLVELLSKDIDFELDQTFFKKIPSIVRLNLNLESDYQFYWRGWGGINKRQIQFNPDSNYYLTTIVCRQTILKDQQQQFLLKKQAMLAHLVIYSQLIKPFISYQADYIHWDLSIDF